MTKETEFAFCVWGCKKLYKANNQRPANMENGSHLSSHYLFICLTLFATATLKVVVISFPKRYQKIMYVKIINESITCGAYRG